MTEKIFSNDTGDFIGTATAHDNGHNHYKATSDTGRTRSVTCHKAAVAWLNVQYNRTH